MERLLFIKSDQHFGHRKVALFNPILVPEISSEFFWTPHRTLGSPVVCTEVASNKTFGGAKSQEDTTRSTPTLKDTRKKTARTLLVAPGITTRNKKLQY